MFPGAQDFVIDNGGEHGADYYLSHPAVAGVIGRTLFPTKDLARADTDIAVRLDDQAAIALLVLHFGHAVANEIKDGERATRYSDALKLQQDDVAHALLTATKGVVAPEIGELAAGQLPILPHRWEADEVVGELVILALTNIVEPHEIDVDRAPLDALPNIAVELGFQRNLGVKVGQAITEVQAAVGRKGGVPWGKVITAAAGIALVAAGPVGLAVAAPATAYGAAAITGGLAAFGPGGMVGGLAMLGGLAGTGAAVTAGAVASGAGGGIDQNPTKLIIRAATEYARKLLDLGFDESLWYSLANFETQLSAELNRLSAFSDKDSPKVKRLIEGRQVVQRLMTFLLEKGLSPRALEAAVAADTMSDNEIRALEAADPLTPIESSAR